MLKKMKKSVVLAVIISSLMVVLTGCSNKDKMVSVQEDSQDIIEESVKEDDTFEAAGSLGFESENTVEKDSSDNKSLKYVYDEYCLRSSNLYESRCSVECSYYDDISTKDKEFNDFKLMASDTYDIVCDNENDIKDLMKVLDDIRSGNVIDVDIIDALRRDINASVRDNTLTISDYRAVLNGDSVIYTHESDVSKFIPAVQGVSLSGNIQGIASLSGNDHYTSYDIMCDSSFEVQEKIESLMRSFEYKNAPLDYQKNMIVEFLQDMYLIGNVLYYNSVDYVYCPFKDEVYKINFSDNCVEKIKSQDYDFDANYCKIEDLSDDYSTDNVIYSERFARSMGSDFAYVTGDGKVFAEHETENPVFEPKGTVKENYICTLSDDQLDYFVIASDTNRQKIFKDLGIIREH